MFGAASVCLQQYTEEHLGQEKWRSLLVSAGLPPNKNYYYIRFYPDDEFDKLWRLGALELGVCEKKMLRQLGNTFGKYTIQIYGYGIVFFKNWRSNVLMKNRRSHK